MNQTMIVQALLIGTAHAWLTNTSDNVQSADEPDPLLWRLFGMFFLLVFAAAGFVAMFRSEQYPKLALASELLFLLLAPFAGYRAPVACESAV